MERVRRVVREVQEDHYFLNDEGYGLAFSSSCDDRRHGCNRYTT